MDKNSRPRVFIGSSREALNIARGIKTNLEEVAEVRIWDEDLFEPGQYTLDQLLQFTHSFDFAVFVWSGDDAVVSRGESLLSPRDNVLFEAGIFYGALGKGRVFLFVSSEDRPKIPSDLFGLAVIEYRRPSDGNYRAAVSTASYRVADIIKSHPRPVAEGLTALHTPANYVSLEWAKSAIKDACKKSPEIRILSNKGLVFFGLDESIVSLAEAEDYKELKRLRIILLGTDSRWINRGLMALRQHESVSDFKKELSSSHVIVESGMKKFARRLGLHRSGIKYHQVEPYFRMVITDKLAFVSSYAENPTTQVRDLPIFLFENQPGSLYGAFKRHFNDLWHNNSQDGEYLQDTIETEISSGGILIKRQDDRLFVALVMRDDGSWVLPKGHKEKMDESLDTAAIREVSEEVGLPPRDIRVIKPLDEYAYDETAHKFNSKKIVYLFLMEFTGDVHRSLTPDLDHTDARWWPLDEQLPFMFYAYQKTLLAQIAKNEFGVDINLT